jgi:hypothetical protein
VIPGRHAEPGHGAADHAAADDAYRCHDRANPGTRSGNSEPYIDAERPWLTRLAVTAR